VESPVGKAFLEACLEEISKVRVGDPLDRETDMGPLINENQLRKVEEHVRDAVEKGAKILHGESGSANVDFSMRRRFFRVSTTP